MAGYRDSAEGWDTMSDFLGALFIGAGLAGACLDQGRPWVVAIVAGAIIVLVPRIAAFMDVP